MSQIFFLRVMIITKKICYRAFQILLLQTLESLNQKSIRARTWNHHFIHMHKKVRYMFTYSRLMLSCRFAILDRR